jgi:hypothetical protein
VSELLPAQANGTMHDKLQDRVQKLKDEFKRGKDQLAETESRAQLLRETLLRISGAIQVLEEELGVSPGASE